MRVDEFLTSRRIPFEILYHRPAYTANRIAQLLHVSGKEMAKTVVLRTSKGYMLAVLPASCRIDLEELRQELSEGQVSLASESEIAQIFPDCELGAMPPFGSLYQLPTWVDESLTKDEEIVFEGQSHEEAIRMNCRDYMDTEHPHLGHFACR